MKFLLNFMIKFFLVRLRFLLPAFLPLLFWLSASSAEIAPADPADLLAPWSGPYGGVPPWDKIAPAQFPAAFARAIDLRREEIRLITENTAAPTFANTIIALEKSGRALDRLEALWGVFTANLQTPEVNALDQEWAPRLSAAYDEIVFDRRLFRRIETVYRQKDAAGLGAVEMRLVEKIYQNYCRLGAQLDDADQSRLGQINQELAELYSTFAARVTQDENQWLHLHTSEELSGLPADLQESARAAAQERHLEGWVILNTRSFVDPFLTFADRRDLRQKAWKMFKERGDHEGKNDTKDLIIKILQLRQERAALLGFASHAHWRMQETMARHPEQAIELMLRVWKPAVARVQEEVTDMQALAEVQQAGIIIEPWDYLYYAEKLRKLKYDFDQNLLKPYFELNQMIQAAFWTAEQLFGLTFQEITGTIPVFEPSVRVWEVRDQAAGAPIGLFYADYFARAGKRSGAWMSTYRIHEAIDDKVLPLTSNNNNFIRGQPGEPVLLSLDDAETLFHEFGHALHYLLSNNRYPSLSNTPRDFVEYPSQVLEHWVLSEPVLRRYARHYQTGRPMPTEMLARVEALSKFNQGYLTVEYLAAALVDMKLHLLCPPPTDLARYEREILTEIGMPRQIALRHRLPHFLHLFSSDAYSAGYYSYLWSEVMDADTWACFVESGDVFHPALAAQLRALIFAPQNSSDRAAAFRAFRGRDPDVAALLKERGFPVN